MYISRNAQHNIQLYIIHEQQVLYTLYSLFIHSSFAVNSPLIILRMPVYLHYTYIFSFFSVSKKFHKFNYTFNIRRMTFDGIFTRGSKKNKDISYFDTWPFGNGNENENGNNNLGLAVPSNAIRSTVVSFNLEGMNFLEVKRSCIHIRPYSIWVIWVSHWEELHPTYVCHIQRDVTPSRSYR